MGRYYSGDINGKFWVAVQSSDDASFFGGEEMEPQYLEYYFDESHQAAIVDGIAKCRTELGERKEELDAYFTKHGMYNDDELAASLGVKVEDLHKLLVWYARLELGEKILKCVEEKGHCNFEAEL